LFPRVALIALLAATLSTAKDPKTYNQVSTDAVTLMGKAYMDPAAIKQLVGDDLGGHYIVIEMTVSPTAGKPVNIQLDSFTLFAEGDGDRTKPQTAAEITASDSMVLKRGESGIGSLGEVPGVKWSGVGFGGRSSKPKETTDKDAASAPVQKGKKNDALKASLEQKALPEKETSQPVTGLLYFPMEKKKLKDLALFYDTPNGKARMYFKDK
jgi:hypothetical protein